MKEHLILFFVMVFTLIFIVSMDYITYNDDRVEIKRLQEEIIRLEYENKIIEDFIEEYSLPKKSSS